jgi:hypothetical protein
MVDQKEGRKEVYYTVVQHCPSYKTSPQGEFRSESGYAFQPVAVFFGKMIYLFHTRRNGVEMEQK